MKKEFVRYRMARFRKIVGGSQILAVIALSLGAVIPLFSIVGSFALCVMMVGAIGVRAHIKDRLIVALPAIFYFILSAILFGALMKENWSLLQDIFSLTLRKY